MHSQPSLKSYLLEAWFCKNATYHLPCVIRIALLIINHHSGIKMVIINDHEYLCEEELRLQEDRERTAYWKKWGSYLSERQWATGLTSSLIFIPEKPTNLYSQFERIIRKLSWPISFLDWQLSRADGDAWTCVLVKAAQIWNMLISRFPAWPRTLPDISVGWRRYSRGVWFSWTSQYRIQFLEWKRSFLKGAAVRPI